MNGAQHADMLDDVAVYALGTLAPVDAQRVREHLEACEECRAEYGQLVPAVGAVARGAEACSDAVSGDVYASPLLKARIMRDVRSSLPQRSQARARETRFPLWTAYAVAAAALLVAASLGFINMSLHNQLLQYQTAQVAAPAPEAGVSERTLADLVNQKAKRYIVPGGEIVRSDNRLYIAMHDIAPPPKGKVYQAWTLPKGSKTMVPGATFVPDKRGVAIVALGVDASKQHAVAVSIEPPGGSKAPTTSPVVLELLE